MKKGNTPGYEFHGGQLIDEEGNLIGKVTSLGIDLAKSDTAVQLNANMEKMLHAFNSASTAAKSAAFTLHDFSKLETKIITPNGPASGGFFSKEMEKLVKQKSFAEMYGAGAGKMVAFDSQLMALETELFSKHMGPHPNHGNAQMPACENPECGFHQYMFPKHVQGAVDCGNGPIYGKTKLFWYAATVNDVEITSRLCAACFAMVTSTWDAGQKGPEPFCENEYCGLYHQSGLSSVFKYIVTDLSAKAYFKKEAYDKPAVAETKTIHRHLIYIDPKKQEAFGKRWFCDCCFAALRLVEDLHD